MPAVLIALVVNPHSGPGVDPSRVERQLQRFGATVERFGLGEVERAAASGAERLAIAGGDGSIGPAAAAASARGLTLAVIPLGTANDFARHLGIPEDLAEACRLAVEGQGLHRVELGRMDGRPFVNVASAGLAAQAARRAAGLKRALGPLAYAVGAVRAGARAAPIECSVRCDGAEVFAGRAWQVIVASSGAFGGGAGVEVASVSDGRLDVTVIEAGPRPRLMVHAFGLRFHRIVAQRGVRHGRCRVVQLGVPPGTEYNVDGELVRHGPARFTVQPAAVAVVVGAHRAGAVAAR